MAELAGQVVPAAQHFALKADADAEAVRRRHEDEVAGRPFAAAVHRPELRERADAAGVFDLDRQARRLGEHLAQIDVVPSERGRVQHAHRRALDHPGHGHADAGALVDVGVVGQQLLDAGRQRLHEPLADRDRSAA